MNWLEMSESEILAIANPIMDNLMQASTDIDHARHVKDFTEKLKSIVTKKTWKHSAKNTKPSSVTLRKENSSPCLEKKRMQPSSGNRNTQNPQESTSRFFA